jgi:hypothetical protein
VGISEETDAIVVIVSEETGRISVAHNGKMITYPGGSNNAAIMRWISKALPADVSERGFLPKRIKSVQKFLLGKMKGFGL